MSRATPAALVIAAIAAVTSAGATAKQAARPPWFNQGFSSESFGNFWTTLYPDGTRTKPGEAETYVDATLLRENGLPVDLEPFRFSHGRVSITARKLDADGAAKLKKPYVSGLFTTAGRRLFQYGHFEIKAVLPKGGGLWPAFWLMSPRTDAYAEIDIMEMLGADPRKIYSTLHHGPNWKTRKMDQATYVLPPSSEGRPHVYSVDWGAKRTVFRIDGRVTGDFITAPELKTPMYLIVNMTVSDQWKQTIDEKAFPATMRIDHVKVTPP